MKRKIVIVACVAALLLVGLCLLYPGIVKRSLEKEAESLFSVYQIVRDMNFASGRLDKNALTLYDARGQQLTVINVDRFDGRDVIRLRNDTATKQIYFILGGSVDDEYGILYTADNAVNMDGLHKLTRMGGNCFYYQTY